MKPQVLPSQRRVSSRKGSSGFTVIEALIAGLVVASVMTAVARLSLSAMATSRNQSSRNAIEAAINDHIQLVQMQDSYLTPEALVVKTGMTNTTEALEIACGYKTQNAGDTASSPSTYLKNHLQVPTIAGETPHPAVTIDWNDANRSLLVITYSFEAPESSIGIEKRIVDVNPNFSSQCYDVP